MIPSILNTSSGSSPFVKDLRAQHFAFDRGDFARSIDLGKRTSKIAAAQFGEIHEFTVMIRLHNARAFAANNDLSSAFDECSRVICDTNGNIGPYALALETRGDIHLTQGSWRSARNDLFHAVDVLNELTELDPGQRECRARCAMFLSYADFREGTGDPTSNFISACDTFSANVELDNVSGFNKLFTRLPLHDEIGDYFGRCTSAINVDGPNSLCIFDRRAILVACANTCLKRGQTKWAEHIALNAYGFFNFPPELNISALLPLAEKYQRDYKSGLALPMFRSIRENTIGDDAVAKIVRGRASIGIGKICISDGIERGHFELISGLLELEEGLHESGADTSGVRDELRSQALQLRRLEYYRPLSQVIGRFKERGLSLEI